MQIIEAEGRKFRVIHTVNLERFKDQQHVDQYLHGSMYLRQNNSNVVHIVDEIKDAVFEDLPPEPEVQTSQAEVTASQV
jgi:hypothetical protein